MQSAGNLAKQCVGLETAFDQAINGHENMKALEALEKLTPEVMARIDETLGNPPEEE